MGSIDKVRAMDAEEAVPEEVFPLADTGFVAVTMPVGCEDRDFLIV